MLFTSTAFFYFFFIVTALYFLTPGRFRWVLLLTASTYFYVSWEPLYIIVLLVSILVDYYCGLRISQTKSRLEKRYFFILSLFINLGFLFLFKYLDFFNLSLKTLLNQINVFYDQPLIHLVAPLGISYFTLKKLSYMIDVYRGNQMPAKHLGKFALYVSFFPTITAGPIDRVGRLLPQLDIMHRFDPTRVINGVKLIVWGMFKKVVIADRLAVFVSLVYDNPHMHQGTTLLLATVFFSIQIYADFSGYSDMAIGLAQVFGVELADNFNRPYFATSITEFWKRWHISLTSWLRDYLFLPCAYAISRRIKRDWLLKIKAESWAYALGMLTTMLLCGLWHGANWTFIMWGGLHALYLILSFMTRKTRKKWRKKINGAPIYLKTVLHGLSILFTFCGVSFIWIFFRANSLSDAVYIVTHLTGTSTTFATVFNNSGFEFPIVLAAIGFMLLLHLVQPHAGMRELLAKKPLIFRWIVYILLLLAIINLGNYDETPFIYLQF